MLDKDGKLLVTPEQLSAWAVSGFSETCRIISNDIVAYCFPLHVRTGQLQFTINSHLEVAETKEQICTDNAIVPFIELFGPVDLHESDAIISPMLVNIFPHLGEHLDIVPVHDIETDRFYQIFHCYTAVNELKIWFEPIEPSITYQTVDSLIITAEHHPIMIDRICASL